MRGSTVIVTGVMLPALVLLGAEGRAAEEDAEQCCFTNREHVGVCREERSEEITCDDILEYLNTPNSSGKKYCGNTDVRGGWTRVECDPEREGTASAEVGRDGGRCLLTKWTEPER